jgi:hypothetical protein
MTEPELPLQENVEQPQLVQPFLPQTFLERHGIHPVLFAFISLILIFILYQFVGSLITLLIFGLDLTKANVTGLRIATGVGQILFILVPTFFLIQLVTFRPTEYMRLKAPNPLAIVHAIVGVFSLQQLLQVYLYFQEKIPLPEFVREFQDKFKSMYEETYKMLAGSDSVPELLFVILIIAVLPSITEEFFFRGLIQRNMEKGLTPVLGYVLTGIIFGAYHLNPFTFIPLGALGVYLGFLTTRSGSIWVSSAAHFFNNALACLALYLNIDDDALLASDPATMNTTDVLMLFAVMLLIFSVSTYLFLKTTAPKETVVQEQKEMWT